MPRQVRPDICNFSRRVNVQVLRFSGRFFAYLQVFLLVALVILQRWHTKPLLAGSNPVAACLLTVFGLHRPENL
jgi:hypothetical protein